MMRRGLGVSLLAGVAFLAPAQAASAATITVTAVGDAVTDNGNCTLREAITAANTNTQSGGMVGECAAGAAPPTVDTIDFSIAGVGPHTIAPLTQLPDLNGAVTLDGGLTDPGPIVLDGVNIPTLDGLDLEIGGNTVRRLAFVRFRTGLEPGFTGANTIELNRIGTDFSDAGGLGNETGIQVNGDGNTIRDNVISGNDQDGVFIFTGENNTIVDNRIGTDNAGTAALPNTAGVFIQAGVGNAIGGSSEADENVISANTGAGVNLSSGEDNRIVGNLIGTDATGTADLGNVTGVNATGGTGTVIGSATAGEGNVISGNSEGVVARAEGTSVDGNLIGTNEAGTAAIGNTLTGVVIEGDDITIGSNAAGNVVSGQGGNGSDGILVDPFGADGTGVVIENNRVGTTADGNSALENDAGISVTGGEGVQVLDNLVSGNDTVGIAVDASFDPVPGTVIQGNEVGTGAGGGALANDGPGLNVVDSDGAVVGTAVDEANVFSSNAGDGVHIGPNSTATAVLRNVTTLNDGLGIDLQGGIEDASGVTANDIADADTGANDLQNFPVIDTAVGGTTTAVAGSINSTPDTDYLLYFYRSGGGDPSGHGEGIVFLGTADVSTDSAGDARFAVSGLANTPIGQVVTATATSLKSNGDPVSTSEFAANVVSQGCDVTGSSGDDPAVAGTAADEVICALEGDDVIDPGGGDDLILGGEGADELDLSAATGEVDLDLGLGLGAAAVDTLSVLEVEDVKGSDFDDTIEGSDERNTLKGRDGKDTLTSKDGKDKLRGGDGGDELDGGKGDKDDLDGDDGKDRFDGGKGDKDDCDGGPDKDRKPAPGCEKKKSIP